MFIPVIFFSLIIHKIVKQKELYVRGLKTLVRPVIVICLICLQKVPESVEYLVQVSITFFDLFSVE